MAVEAAPSLSLEGNVYLNLSGEVPEPGLVVVDAPAFEVAPPAATFSLFFSSAAILLPSSVGYCCDCIAVTPYNVLFTILSFSNGP